MALEFLEGVGDISPGQGSFNARTGKFTRAWHLKISSPADVPDAIQKILGRTRYWGDNNGKLKRELPLADPQFPHLYAESVAPLGKGMRDPTGLAFAERVSPAPINHPLVAPTFGLYPHYDLVVESGPRPFRVLADSAVTMAAGSWFNWLGQQQPFTYATEYVRFIDEVRQGTAEAVSGQQGTMVFRSAVPGPIGVGGRTFPARPRMFLPNGSLSVVWFNVPYRYLTSTNSYIDGAQGQRPWFGCVNQNSLTLLGVTYRPGALLYLNWQQQGTRFPAAIDTLVPTEFGDEYGVYKFVDIALNFALTWRTAPAGDLPATVPNPNFIRAGFNLQPWLVDRRFHYASSAPTPGAGAFAQTPSHYSAPLELLFTDPDFAQAVSND